MYAQTVALSHRVHVASAGATLVLVLTDVESDSGVYSDERDACDLLAYDELRQHAVANVFQTVEQSGFCSDTESESDESDAEE